MAQKKPEKKSTQTSAKSSTTRGKGLTAEERAALKETMQERKAAARGANDEKALLAKIAEMPEPDRAMAKRLHGIIKDSAPGLSPKTWYGMPAFFTPASKFKARYATLGFNDDANLDEGALWPVAFALKALTAAEEAKISALVKKAVR